MKYLLSILLLFFSFQTGYCDFSRFEPEFSALVGDDFPFDPSLPQEMLEELINQNPIFLDVQSDGEGHALAVTIESQGGGVSSRRFVSVYWNGKSWGNRETVSNVEASGIGRLVICSSNLAFFIFCNNTDRYQGDKTVYIARWENHKWSKTHQIKWANLYLINRIKVVTDKNGTALLSSLNSRDTFKVTKDQAQKINLGDFKNKTNFVKGPNGDIFCVLSKQKTISEKIWNGSNWQEKIIDIAKKETGFSISLEKIGNDFLLAWEDGNAISLYDIKYSTRVSGKWSQPQTLMSHCIETNDYSFYSHHMGDEILFVFKQVEANHGSYIVQTWKEGGWQEPQFIAETGLMCKPYISFTSNNKKDVCMAWWDLRYRDTMQVATRKDGVWSETHSLSKNEYLPLIVPFLLSFKMDAAGNVLFYPHQAIQNIYDELTMVSLCSEGWVFPSVPRCQSYQVMRSRDGKLILMCYEGSYATYYLFENGRLRILKNKKKFGNLELIDFIAGNNS